MAIIKINSASSIIRYASGIFTFLLIFGITACGQKESAKTDAGTVKVEELANNLDHPWGMDFLPDGRLLVTERTGDLRIMNTDHSLSEPISGVPDVLAEDQGGLLDVALDPDYANNSFIYLSFSEPGENGTASTALGRGKLENDQLTDFNVIFSQQPKVEGAKHFGGRIIFHEGKIFLTMGERFKFDPAQDLTNHMGTIVRVNPDGSIPQDNPFVGQTGADDAIWSYGHRNIEAGSIDPATGSLWVVEMGPQGGDELNKCDPGRNYGWPEVSWGEHYDGEDIPDPSSRPEFADAAMHWTPVISPSGMQYYTGSEFPEWEGMMMIGGLTAKGVVIVNISGDQAEEVDRIELNSRIRDVMQAPDGSVYVLTDKDNGQILRLSKKN